MTSKRTIEGKRQARGAVPAGWAPAACRLAPFLAAAVATAAICATTVPARAEYSASGWNLQVVQSGQGLVNAGINYQMNQTWNENGAYQYQPLSTTFTLPSCTAIDYSRLYLDIWGGMASNTASVAVTVNGTPLTFNGTQSALSIGNTMGGMNDKNPTYNAAETCVYGSGYGTWQLAVAVSDSLLYTNGSPNTVTWTINDPQRMFDGRMYSASLVTVYTSPSLNQTLDYYLAEADGTMRNTPGATGAPSSRTLAITGVNATAAISSATYYAAYTFAGSGGSGQYNSLLFNGTALGSPTDAVAQSSADYGPTLLSFNVAGMLSSTSTVQYSVAMTGGEALLQANVGLLAVTHPLPVSGVWTLPGSGTWSTAANWQGGNVPANAPDTAAFGPVIGSNVAVIVLDGSRTLGGLSFATTGGGGYVLARTDGSSMLTLANGGSAAPLAVSSGAQTIAVPLVLGGNLGVSLSAGSQLAISGPIGESGGSNESLSQNGGELLLFGSNSYTGGTSVSSGLLLVESSRSLPAGTGLYIGPGATVELGDPPAASGSPAQFGSAGDAPAAAAPFRASAAPEPGTLALLAAGGFALLAWRRARLNRKSRVASASPIHTRTI